MSEATPVWSSGDFQLGAGVHSGDDVDVGKLVHVLVAGSDYELKALVVKESRRFSGHRLSPGSFLIADEFVVPLDAVKSVSHDRIDLKLTAADVRHLSPYLSYREKDESRLDAAEDEVGALASGPEVPHWLEQVANKPADELEIDGDENVMLGHTGKKLGHVKEVLFEGGELVGVVLRPEGLLKQEVILPRRFLERSDDAALFVNLSETDIQQLKPFRPSD